MRRRAELELYYKKGKLEFSNKCSGCTKDCKQPYFAEILVCPKFKPGKNLKAEIWQ